MPNLGPSTTVTLNSVDALSPTPIPTVDGILYASGVDVVTPTDTTEDILATIQIPAGILGLNGYLEAFAKFTCTNNANVKTVRMRLGTSIAGTAILTAAITSNTGAVASAIVTQKGVASSQDASAIVTLDAATNVITANQALTLDLSASQAAAINLYVTAQKATAGDVLTLKFLRIKVYAAA